MEKRQFKNILVVRTDRIGDVVLTTPALEVLRKAYPKSRISLMVAPGTKDIVEGNPFIDELIVYDKKGTGKGVFGFCKTVADLGRKRFDLVINYHLKSRMNLILFLAGIPRRVGFTNEKLGFLLNEQYPDPRTNGQKHETEYCLDLLRSMGIDCHGFNLWVSVSPVSEAWIDETFKAYGIMPGEKLIAVHPGASCISKRWPPERFGEVADKLAQKYHAKILLIGSADDQLIAKEVLMSMKQPVVDMTGKTTVSHLISLLKRCTLLVSNDSGPVHLAVGVKTPVISIFGRNQAGLAPTRWKPLGFLDVALHRDVGCKVCLAHLCELDFKCLKSISVDHVLEAAEAIFNKSTVLP